VSKTTSLFGLDQTVQTYKQHGLKLSYFKLTTPEC